MKTSTICRITLLFSLLVSLAAGQTKKPRLPDPDLTPGVASDITKEELCNKSFHTRDERLVTDDMKKQVYAAYKITPGKGVCAKKPNVNTGRPEACEIDHLISLELGGANDIKNLWPQPYTQHPGAHEKDGLENWLNKQVCSGAIKLADAQKAIATDWFAEYQIMLKAKAKPKATTKKATTTKTTKTKTTKK
jgi:hypothetical protein